MRYLISAVFLTLVCPNVSAAERSFEQLDWFQITFGQSIKYFSWNAEQPIGLAADPFKPDRTFHFYRWDLSQRTSIQHEQFLGNANTPKVALRQVAANSDKTRLLIANSSHEVLIFDRSTNTVIKRFSGHRNGTTFVAFSQDESRISAIDDYRHLWIWDFAGDEETPIAVIDLPQWAGRIEFTSNDAIRVYGEEHIVTYDIASGEQTNSVALNPKLDIDRMHRPESILLVPGSDDFIAESTRSPEDHGVIARYNRSTGALVWQHDLGMIQTPPGWPATANSPNGYALTPSSKCLVVGDHGGYRVLNPTSGELLFRQNINASGYVLAFSPDGRKMVDTGGSNITTWLVPEICL